MNNLNLPQLPKVEKLDKYKENLSIITDSDGNRFIKSYETVVAHLTNEGIIQLGWWSKTTQKHINYVSIRFGLPITKYFQK
jgi:hypothetical protein